ncbi:hypothetical protein ZWY2020_007465 [Hordeum vulgare]|nr:hypothetical protein ZWY2020_007465 [Hordeum vulgare]
MEQSLGWQKAIEDLAGNHVQLRQQYGEIACWFPSVQMMRNHAPRLVKVMTEAEKLRAFPDGEHPRFVLPPAMREVTNSNDPRQRARWWMYRSSTTPPVPDNERVASRAEHIADVIIAMPAPINNRYWDRLHPSILLAPSDDSDDESSDAFVLLSDDEEEAEVEMAGSVVAAVEGDKDIPIDVEKLPDVQEAALTVKDEVQDDDELLSDRKKRPIPVKVRRSERLKKMKKMQE